MTDKNPYLMVVLGDFNAKTNTWYTNDSTAIEGSKIDIWDKVFKSGLSKFCGRQPL